MQRATDGKRKAAGTRWSYPFLHGAECGCLALRRQLRVGVKIGDEVVAHGEEGRRRAGGDINLVVDVLDMMAYRLFGDERVGAIWRLERPRASRRSTSTSRSLNPPGHSRGAATYLANPCHCCPKRHCRTT